MFERLGITDGPNVEFFQLSFYIFLFFGLEGVLYWIASWFVFILVVSTHSFWKYYNDFANIR